jgi:hypothetical protein
LFLTLKISNGSLEIQSMQSSNRWDSTKRKDDRPPSED